MSQLRQILTAAALVAATTGTAHAGLNDPNCVPAADRPFPVVLAHGRGGHATDLVAITAALEADGRCVYGEDYGQINGVGETGMDHLATSGAQIGAVIDRVLLATGAARVDVIGYSEGTGVLANFILGRGGANRVHRAVSFGGLHHPYAHAGAPGFFDNDVFLPNLIVEARKVLPGVTAQQVITAALDLYAAAGGQLAGVYRDVATSPFASDLFEPVYWAGLHGGLSEPPGRILRLDTDGHSIATSDAAPTVCYTNIVSFGDIITGPSAGFQDPAPNVDNFLLVALADHGQILSHPEAIGRMMAGLRAPCAFAQLPAQGPNGPDDAADPDELAGESDNAAAGCSAGGGTGLGFGLALGLGALVTRRRRPRHAGAAPTARG